MTVRTRTLRVLTGAAAMAAVAMPAFAVIAATTAVAEGMTGQIVSASGQGDGHLAVVFGLQNPTTGAVIDPATVKVAIDGQVVPATAKPIGQAASVPTRVTVLTMDISGSMNNGTSTAGVSKLQAAKNAANAYLGAVPSDVSVGLVTFADQVRIVVKPTTDHRSVQRAVDGLTATGATHLYDAVIAANGLLGSQGVRDQLVLSDGADEGSTATLGQATASIVATKGVVVDAVALGVTTAAQQQALTALTTAGRGRVVLTDNAAALTDIFTQQAAAQASQVLIDVTVPSSVAGKFKQVGVEAQAGGQTVADTGSYILPLSPTGGPTNDASNGPIPVPTPSAGIFGQSWTLVLGLLALALGLFAILAVAFVSSDTESQQTGRVRRRLSRYSLIPHSTAKSTVATSGALGQSQVARSASEFAGRVVQNRDLDGALQLKLEAAGLPLKPGEWLIIHVGTGIVAGLIMAFLSGFGVVQTLVGLALGLIAPYAFLTIKESRRKREFDQALPGTLQLLSGSLAAGYSLPQAVDSVVRESTGSMAVELNKALVEARLGVPVEDALEAVGQRMDSVDFAWVVMAIRIQREVGGNLAEVLATVAGTMRERERLRRQVQVLSAEGRLSAFILGALPVVFGLYLLLVRPEYIGLLLSSPLGVIMLVVGFVLMVVGAFWLRKVITVEV